MEKMQSLNKLLVPTFRGSKVNDYEINNFKIPSLIPYNKSYFKATNEVTILNIQEATEKIKNIYQNYNYGVNKELVNLSENKFNSGVYIKIPENTKIIEPIVLNYEMDYNNKVLMDYNFIQVGKNSEVTVVINYTSGKFEDIFHNGVTKILAEPGSKVKVVKLQSLNDISINLDSNVAFIEREAKVEWFSVELGGKVSASNYISYLEGEESESLLDSIYIVNKNRELDMSYIMSHKGRRTISNIKTHGIVNDTAEKVFRGTLDFKRGATRAKGREEEHVLVLDKAAKTYSIPTLICEEEDVEGQHAASVGQIDDNKLFYLMSRGFKEEIAKKIIIEASFKPVLDAIPLEELRINIEDDIHRRIVNESF